jgi:hypothetical protein
MKKIETAFPSHADDRLFVQDIDLQHIGIMQNYNALLSAGKYTQASDLLNSSDVFFYGAWLLNYFEDRLNILGNYLLSQKVNEDKPIFYIYQENEPDELEDNQVWID